MNLKLTLLTSILCLTFSSKAQDSDYQIKRTMSDYYSVLKSEGYAPSYDDVDDIKFKVEGKLYWIERQDYANQLMMTRYITNEQGCTLDIYSAVNYGSKSARYANAFISEDCKQVMIRSYMYNSGKDVEDIVTRAILGIKLCLSKCKEKLD